MSKTAVANYEKVRDILIFIANSTEPVTMRNLLTQVSDITNCNIRKISKQLIEAGYLEDVRTNLGRAHLKLVPTQLTIDLYRRK